MSTELKSEVVQDSNQVKPSLWSPNAAANWSLLFTPILGAWLHAKNWEALNEPEAAKKSMLWVYAGFVFLLVILFLPDDAGSLPGLIFILAWYFTSAKKQVKYIKEKSIEYQKKSWGKPLLAGVAGILLYLCVGAFILGGSSTIDEVKDGTLGSYKSLTVGEAFDNYSQFKSTSWESFETSNGKRVVQFNGDIRIPQRLKDNGSSKAELIVQFLINDDDSFELNAMQINAVENGRSVSQNMYAMADGILAKIYNNENLMN
jgi:hypothetical protein